MEEGVASECYGSARARETVVDSAVFAVSTGVCGRVRVRPSRRDGNRRGGGDGRMAWEAGESRFAVDYYCTSARRQ